MFFSTVLYLILLVLLYIYGIKIKSKKVIIVFAAASVLYLAWFLPRPVSEKVVQQDVSYLSNWGTAAPAGMVIMESEEAESYVQELQELLKGKWIRKVQVFAVPTPDTEAIEKVCVLSLQSSPETHHINNSVQLKFMRNKRNGKEYVFIRCDGYLLEEFTGFAWRTRSISPFYSYYLIYDSEEIYDWFENQAVFTQE